MDHTHKVCEHVLKYCVKCDLVYCDSCNKEWKEAVNLIYRNVGDLTSSNHCELHN